MTGQQGVPQVDLPAPGLGPLVTDEDVTAFFADLATWRGEHPHSVTADGERAALEAYGRRLLARVGAADPAQIPHTNGVEE